MRVPNRLFFQHPGSLPYCSGGQLLPAISENFSDCSIDSGRSRVQRQSRSEGDQSRTRIAPLQMMFRLQRQQPAISAENLIEKTVFHGRYLFRKPNRSKAFENVLW